VRNDLSGLLAFIERDEAWLARLEDVADEHLRAALDAFDLEFTELGDILSDQLANTLWGCGFEDFLSRRYHEGAGNVVDHYLKRRGWKETVLNREYLAGLRDTPPSLYEVSNVVPGVAMALRDLLSDAPVVVVHERSATKTLRQWDKIAARVIAQRDHHVISGAVLAYSNNAANLLTNGLRKALKVRKGAGLSLTKEELFASAPLLTSAWLMTELPRALEPSAPVYNNSDGDEIVFHDLTFPFLTGVTQKKLGEVLDRVEGLAREGRSFWNWLAPRDPRSSVPKSKYASGKGIMLTSNLGENTVLGTIELKGRVLHASVNSASRAARLEAMIMSVAGSLVRSPLTTVRTMEQMRAEKQPRHVEWGADEVPPAIAKEVMREYLDRHYRQMLGTAIPVLDGTTPRQAVGTEQGRQQVADWLKYLENNSSKQLDTAMADYDFGWIWAELGIESYRR
jgi:hypothetical protein